MSRTPSLLLALAAGCADVHSAREVPLEMSAIRSAVWSVGNDADESSAEGLLVLSSSKDFGCDKLAGKDRLEAIENATADGTGLLFLLSQWGDEQPWDGLWAEADAVTVVAEGDEDGESGRYLSFVAFDGGMAYDFSGEGLHAWATLDKVDAEKATGEFRSDWWWGTFRAETCGDWENTDGVTGTDLTTTPTYSF